MDGVVILDEIDHDDPHECVDFDDVDDHDHAMNDHAVCVSICQNQSAMVIETANATKTLTANAICDFCYVFYHDCDCDCDVVFALDRYLVLSKTSTVNVVLDDLVSESVQSTRCTDRHSR
mmetsp:Transcript_10846/g.16343  ORF Transcript_10846/g.16343 Transcript_10846/m.16343 type:complete len:120 (-) Transcript_10846:802-1161(-)